MQVTIRTEVIGDQALVDTIRLANQACQECINEGMQNKTWNKTKLHNLTYKNIRAKYPLLNSSLVTAVRDQASDMLKRLKLKKKPLKNLNGGIRLNHNTLSVYADSKIVSLSTINGRKKYAIKIPKYFVEKYKADKVTAGTLSIRKGKILLNINIEIPVSKIKKPKLILGVDRGIYNPAVTSDNQFFDSRKIRTVKGKYRFLKGCLQRAGTRSAKRHLRRLANRERRFINDVNHCISKKIVNSKCDAIALEELNIGAMKMRKKRKKGTKFSRLLGSWSPTQLLSFIKYKAEMIGKSIILVNSHYTSQACSRCGDIRKANRKGKIFKCCVCSFSLHSDLNASRNIASLAKGKISRLGVNQPNVACDESKASLRDELRMSIVTSSAF